MYERSLGECHAGISVANSVMSVQCLIILEHASVLIFSSKHCHADINVSHSVMSF